MSRMQKFSFINKELTVNMGRKWTKQFEIDNYSLSNTEEHVKDRQMRYAKMFSDLDDYQISALINKLSESKYNIDFQRVNECLQQAKQAKPDKAQKKEEKLEEAQRLACVMYVRRHFNEERKNKLRHAVKNYINEYWGKNAHYYIDLVKRQDWLDCLSYEVMQLFIKYNYELYEQAQNDYYNAACESIEYDNQSVSVNADKKSKQLADQFKI